eukprot:7284294-Pyramimonas_sp.AAC.1
MPAAACPPAASRAAAVAGSSAGASAGRVGAPEDSGAGPSPAAEPGADGGRPEGGACASWARSGSARERRLLRQRELRARGRDRRRAAAQARAVARAPCPPLRDDHWQEGAPLPGEGGRVDPAAARVPEGCEPWRGHGEQGRFHGDLGVGWPADRTAPDWDSPLLGREAD